MQLSSPFPVFKKKGIIEVFEVLFCRFGGNRKYKIVIYCWSQLELMGFKTRKNHIWKWKRSKSQFSHFVGLLTLSPSLNFNKLWNIFYISGLSGQTAFPVTRFCAPDVFELSSKNTLFTLKKNTVSTNFLCRMCGYLPIPKYFLNDVCAYA